MEQNISYAKVFAYDPIRLQYEEALKLSHNKHNPGLKQSLKDLENAYRSYDLAKEGVSSTT